MVVAAVQSIAGLDHETRQIILESLKDFAKRELQDETLRKIDAGSEFPEAVVRQLVGPEMGLHLLFIPEEQGGMGAGAADICRVCEFLAGVDLGIATSVLATALGIDPIHVGGSEEQKNRWLSQIAEEGNLVAYAVTEPGAGSNVASLKTRADRIERDGQTVGYRLNGTKVFITNGGVADVYTILAKTPDGPSFFVVERGTKGLNPGREEDKHGIRASNTSEIILEDVEVPTDQLLGLEEGQGLVHASKVFGYTRLMVAAFGLGAGADAMKRAVEYARDRVQFATPLIAKQGYTHKLLIPNIINMQAARAYIQEVANRLDRGEQDLAVEASAAKLFATESGCKAADDAVQAHGGYGYIREFHVEKIRRDVRITTIYEGTSEIQQEIVGRGRWRDVLIGKGKLYTDMAEEMIRLHQQRNDLGADRVAQAATAFLELVRRARKARLGRQQHIVFLLADAAVAVETTAALVRKAMTVKKQADSVASYWPDAMATMARIQAGTAANQVAVSTALILESTGTANLAEEQGLLAPAALFGSMQGVVADMDRLATLIATEDLVSDPL